MELGIFNMEVRDKRSQAFANRAKTGSKGGSKSRKGVRTPFDSMSAIEKKKLNGKVKTIMYETIIPIQEFKLKDTEMQKLMLTRWRELYPNSMIKEQMKLHNKAYYDLVDGLNLPPKQKAPYSKRQGKPKTIAVVEDNTTKEIQTLTKPTQEPIQKLLLNGLHLEYNGEYTAEQLSKIFTKLQLLVDSEENKFSLSISLSERE